MNETNLDNFNEDLINLNMDGKEKSVSFLQGIGLLPKEKTCPICSIKMKLIPSKKTTDGVRFRCKRPCRNEISIREGSFFEGSKLPLRALFRFIYYWAYEEASVKKIKRELRMGEEAICNWKNYLREVCSLSIISESV